jgi:hypothetical protein
VRAICAFLIPSPAVDPPAVLGAADLVLQERYAKAHCGDDNWWDPIECVYPDGMSIAVKSNDTVSGLYPPAERWDRLHRRMVDEAIFDFIYYAKGAVVMQRAELEATFPADEPATARDRADAVIMPMYQLLDRIERALSEKSAAGEPMASAFYMPKRCIADAKRIVHHLYDSVDVGENVPFITRLASPYEYRAYDLRDAAGPHCMYIVDMHL